MRKSVQEDGITKYYNYVMFYTDYCLLISDCSEAVLLNDTGKYFSLKESSIGDPTQ